MKEAKPFVMDPKVLSMHIELSVKSRVRGVFHARFCERVRVKLPRSTRPLPPFADSQSAAQVLTVNA